MSRQSEYQLENELVAKLWDSGFSYADISDMDGLRSNLRAQLERLNEVRLTDDEWVKLELKITKGSSIIERARLLREQIVIERDNQPSLRLKLVDQANWSSNSFQVANQITNQNGQIHNRYDVTILINGLPLVQIELKRRGTEIKEAFMQVKRYDRDSYPENGGYFRFIQLFIISNGVNTEYFANNSKLNKLFAFTWSNKENQSINELSDFTRSFLTPEHLINMMFQFTVLTTENQSMVLRPYQCYAVERIVQKVKNEDGNGYIWHTTGSGKTLTSFKASQLITRMPEVKKVVFVVDRKDLDTQTAQEFNSFSDGAFEDTTNTSTLVRQLNDDSVRLIVTTIQKLNKAVSYLETEIARLKNERIVFIFDECHRSQFGATHKRITEFFTRSQMFGFTGTPIFAENASGNELGKRTTADLFGECLHKYLIADAINDRNVLPFKVEYVGSYKDKINKATYSDIDVQNIDIKELMESEQRLVKIKDFILARHSSYTKARTYTAIFATSSIDVLCRYYKLFKDDERFTASGLNMAAVFSYGANDDFHDFEGAENEQQHSELLDGFVTDYNKRFGTRYNIREQGGFDKYNRDVSKRVKSGELDLLLVVNMYLTGFDSKKLNTLYVDKNLRHHGLIQAFSRTNRVEANTKPYGNIVCFRNIKKETDEAVAIFSNNTPNETVFMPSYEVVLKQFDKALESLLVIAPSYQSVDRLIRMTDKEAFIKSFRNVLRKYNLLQGYAEFDHNDLGISEQGIEDYGSKYRDLEPTVQLYRQDAEKASILDEIDFETELLATERIDVDYILDLLASMVDTSAESIEAIKEKLVKKIKNDPKLRSKLELIQKFIDEQLHLLQNPYEIKDSLDQFVEEQKDAELGDIAISCHVQKDELNSVIQRFLWRGMEIPPADVLMNLVGSEVKYLERSKIVKSLTERIAHYTQVYCVGWV